MRHGQTVTETPRPGKVAEGEVESDARYAEEPDVRAANAIAITAAVVLAALGSLFAGLSGVFLYLWGFSPLAASLFWMVALAIDVWAFLTVRQIIRSER